MRLIFESLTFLHRDLLSLHLFLNTETLLLGEEPRFMILTHSLICWYSLGVKSKNIYQRVVNVCRKIVGVK